MFCNFNFGVVGLFLNCSKSFRTVRQYGPVKEIDVVHIRIIYHESTVMETNS